MVDVGRFQGSEDRQGPGDCWPLAVKATAVAGLVIAAVMLFSHERQPRGGGNADAGNPAAVIDEFAKLPATDEAPALP